MLEGSAVSRELTAADRSVQVLLQLIETDPGFDDVLLARMDLSAYDEGDSITGIASENAIIGAPGKVRYSYVQEVTLIVPLPSYGQTVVVAPSTL